MILRPRGRRLSNGNGSRAHEQDEMDRLWADVVRWGLRQTHGGHMPSQEEFEQEYARRLDEAERRLLEAEARREREATLPSPSGGEGEKAEGEPAALPSAPAPANTPGPVLTRRKLLSFGGLVGGIMGLSAATAFGVDKLAGGSASGGSGTSQNVPPDVLAAGATNNVDGSDDPDATLIDQVKLAAINAGRSLYATFHGATTRPMPGHLDRLFPPPPLPAQPGRLREFEITIEEKILEIANGVKWWGWTFNGSIPGPVIRATQGDHVHITVNNATRHPHSLHLHSIHPANQDGVFQIIPAGGQGTYDFVAQPFGVYPYHCHVDPLDQHTARGLYGIMIIDPPDPRPPANEMTMLLNGYDVNFDKQNEVYSVNGMPGYYHENPINLKVGQLNRIYVVNMTEFDAVNSFHLHANMFQYYPAGTSLTPTVLTDVVHLGVADRGILEFTYNSPGQYLFHAHQNELTIHGWVGLFNVV